MTKKRSSTTAQVTTLARVALSGPKGPLNDIYADSFLCLPWSWLKPVLKTSAKNLPWFRELLANVGGRSCFFDEALENALSKGIKQVLILGAGYDSRAIRFKKEDVTFFEVDLPATQHEKLALLKKKKLPHAANFVPVDFETDDLMTRLIEAGFKSEEKSFILWEGVVEYLEEETVKQTLKQLYQFTAQGSILAFDPLYPQEQPSALRKLAAKVVSHLGESRLFAISPEDLKGFLDLTGWRLEKTMSVEELHKAYLKGVVKSPRFGHNYPALAVSSSINRFHPR